MEKDEGTLVVSTNVALWERGKRIEAVTYLGCTFTQENGERVLWVEDPPVLGVEVLAVYDRTMDVNMNAFQNGHAVRAHAPEDWLEFRSIDERVASMMAALDIIADTPTSIPPFTN
jgi:hypothetical protein